MNRERIADVLLTIMFAVVVIAALLIIFGRR